LAFGFININLVVIGDSMSHILLLAALTLGFAPATASLAAEDAPTPAQEFHSWFLKKHEGPSAIISPELVRTDNPHVKPYAAILQTARWDIRSIFVCWENPSSAYAEPMAWTQDAVKRTWQAESSLTFLGWGECPQKSKGIRIQIDDSGPQVKTLGRFLDQMPNGMVLNFTFQNWSKDCQLSREHCIRAIAVHEFGHAIGFTHEQNRPHAPGECKGLRQGSDPDKLLTPYDPDSVMNYCNKKWANDGFLSKRDVEAVQTLYEKRSLQ
jgi:hypothetical protein